MIGIIDYGLGNLSAISNIYRGLGIPATFVSTDVEIKSVDKLILPGVGSFDGAMQCLEQNNLIDCLHHEVMINSKPILGICVGMQIMALASEEGQASGLGWVNATVKKFKPSKHQDKLRLPHMGWNTVKNVNGSLVFTGMQDAKFYFLHSYYFQPVHADIIIGTTHYGEKFISSIRQKNIYGAQFHPEKSHDCGVKFLKNFARYC